MLTARLGYQSRKRLIDNWHFKCSTFLYNQSLNGYEHGIPLIFFLLHFKFVWALLL